MSQGFITNTGLSLLASHQANEQPLIINRFLLANIPDLNPTQAPNLNEPLPIENNRVGAFPVIKPATPGPNQVIYSLVLDSTVGDFTYNWVGLLTENDELIAARYIEPETKLKRQNGFSSGDVVVRNFLLTYTNVENIVNITITPESWQLNFTKATQTTPGLTTYGDQAGTACEGNDSRLATDLSVTHYINGVDVFSSTGKKTFIDRATSQLAGMMAAEDKEKLNAIENGAQVNVGTNLSAFRATNSVELRSSTGNNATIDAATSSAAGVMAASDWQKLNGIQAGAQVNVDTNISVNYFTNRVEIYSSTGQGSAIGLASASRAGLLGNGDYSKLTGIEEGAQKNIGTDLSTALDPNYVTVKSSTGFDVNIFSASSDKAGVLTADLFNKLNSIEFGAQANTPMSLTVLRNADIVDIHPPTGTFGRINPATSSDAGVMRASDKVKLDSLDNVPPGAVVAFARSTPPVGWLTCNGANVGRAIYADLFASIGTQFGNGDGSSTFTLPDMRGRFIRGWTNGSSIDSGRVFGSEQLDAIQNITGSATVVAEVTATSGAFTKTDTGNRYSGSSAPGSRIDFNASRVVRTAAETRPVNRALLYCIKY